jgi:hypothetical protein
MAIQTPSFYEYFNKTYRLDRTPEGEVIGRVLNLITGDFEVAPVRMISEVLFATSSADISRLSEAEFIDETERRREEYLRGDGPIFAIYDVINGMYEQRKSENRSFTPEERALIVTLRRRTFAMWEEEFARQAAGEPPSFEYRSVLA